MMLNTEDLNYIKKETINVLHDFYFYVGENIPNDIRESIKKSKTEREVSSIRKRCIDRIFSRMEEEA